MGIGIGIGIGGGRSRREDGLARVIATLFRASEPGFLSFADPETCFTDTAGTINAQVGQAVAYWKDLSGRNNHATQPTTANRPILGRKPVGGRRNLLVWTEDFGNTLGWSTIEFAGTASRAVVTSNAGVSPFGDMSADRIVFNLNGGTTITDRSYITQNFTAPGSVAYTLSVWLRTESGTASVVLETDSGNDNLAAVTTEWQRFSVTRVAVAGSRQNRIGLRGTTGSSDSATVLAWGAQLELGSTATAYQRVGSRFDVTEPGKPDRHYLFSGGTSDPRWMQTPTIAPGTDKAQVFAGIRKLSDAARGTVIELTASSATNNGALHLTAPNTASATFGFESKGTTLQDAVGSGFSAPVSAVLTGLGNIAGDSAILRVNGAVADTETGDQGTGNYTAAAVFIGRRNGTDNALNGEISSLTIRFGPDLTTEQIELLEQFTASKVSEPTI
jgi:hypothetical protein